MLGALDENGIGRREPMLERIRSNRLRYLHDYPFNQRSIASPMYRAASRIRS